MARWGRKRPSVQAGSQPRRARNPGGLATQAGSRSEPSTRALDASPRREPSTRALDPGAQSAPAKTPLASLPILLDDVTRNLLDSRFDVKNASLAELWG